MAEWNQLLLEIVGLPLQPRMGPKRKCWAAFHQKRPDCQDNSAIPNVGAGPELQPWGLPMNRLPGYSSLRLWRFGTSRGDACSVAGKRRSGLEGACAQERLSVASARQVPSLGSLTAPEELAIVHRGGTCRSCSLLGAS